MHRAISFDETRMDDKTHGDGGDRKGRTESSIRCGFWDNGECVGQKNASHTSSMCGGSNAAGEPVPAWFSVAAKHVDPAIFQLGPMAKVNGKLIASQGRSNEKGSVTGDFAAVFIDESVVPMLNAHGGVSSTRRAVMACDGVVTHMTSKFLDKCKECHIVVVLRTPYCSNSIQFEDLMNFWVLKNAKDVGWYKVKQDAIFERLGQTCGSSATLSHAKQLELMVPCWNVAFSEQTNRTAWEMVSTALPCSSLIPALAATSLTPPSPPPAPPPPPAPLPPSPPSAPPPPALPELVQDHPH